MTTPLVGALEDPTSPSTTVAGLPGSLRRPPTPRYGTATRRRRRVEPEGPHRSLGFQVPRRHDATVLLIASRTTTAAGFNFDGYAKGRLTITVPAGWTVHVVFENNGPLPHSVMVVPWSTKPTATHPTPAFAGATTPQARSETPKGGSSRFTFVARKKYRLLCAVPGHDAAGMWDTLVVKRGARTASAAA